MYLKTTIDIMFLSLDVTNSGYEIILLEGI